MKDTEKLHPQQAAGEIPIRSFSDLASNIHRISRNGEAFLPDRLRSYDHKDGERVFLFTHEMDLTGAPIALLYLAEMLEGQGYLPVIVSLSKGALLEQCSVPVVVMEDMFENTYYGDIAGLFDLFIINTIVGAPLIHLLMERGLPTIWWIHEADAAYHESHLSHMPRLLRRNIHVYAVGGYARDVLKRYRPLYDVKKLYYYLPKIDTEIDREINAEINTEVNTEINTNINAEIKGDIGVSYRLPDSAKDKMKFALVGLQVHRKGQDILADAIEQLPDNYLKNSYFIFVGREAYEPIKQRIDELTARYPQNILYIEELDKRTLLSLYRQIDCEICASRDDPMPVVVAEALQLGKMVICSENTGTAAILRAEQFGLIYRNNSGEELREMIIRYMDDRAAYDDEEAAKKIYEKYFSEERFSREISGIVKAVKALPDGNITGDRDMTISDGTKARRAGIFVFYNKRGHVERYVEYLLRSVRSCLDKLYIVVNGEVGQEGKRILEGYGDELYVRENRGYDAAAFKHAILEYAGLDELAGYDEVICFNDTMYGPFIPFEDILDSMAGRDVDLWGIMKGFKSASYPDHIQSWFYCFRQSLVKSPDFKAYWEAYDDSIDDFWGVIYGHEVKFAKYFADRGYKWDVYVASESYRSQNPDWNINIHAMAVEDSLRYMGMPFLKRKPFSIDKTVDIYQVNMGQDLERGLRYISEAYDYPVDMIYEDLLHNYNVYDIYESLNLNYIIPGGNASKNGQKLPLSDKERELRHGEGLLIFIRCGTEKSLKYMWPYVARAAEEYDVYLCVPDGLADMAPGRVKIIHEAKDEGIYSLKKVEKPESYQYVAYIDDNHILDNIGPVTVYETVLYSIMENMLKDAGHISAITDVLESDPGLGVLLAPTCPCYRYIEFIRDSWADAFDGVSSVAEELKLSCNISRDKPIISSSGCFYCRRSVIDRLLQTDTQAVHERLKDVRIYSRLLQFAAQDLELYTGTVMSDRYAAEESVLYRNDLAAIMKACQPQAVGGYLHTYVALEYKKNNQLRSMRDGINWLQSEVDRLYPLTSLKLQLKLRLRRYTPDFMYYPAVFLKRLVLGPRETLFKFDTF